MINGRFGMSHAATFLLASSIFLAGVSLPGRTPVGAFASAFVEKECDSEFEFCEEGIQLREVFGVSPREGALSGGTRVTMSGAGFSADFVNRGGK